MDILIQHSDVHNLSAGFRKLYYFPHYHLKSDAHWILQVAAPASKEEGRLMLYKQHVQFTSFNTVC